MAYILKDEEVERKRKAQASQTRTKFNKLVKKGKLHSAGPLTAPMSEQEKQRRLNELIILYFKWDMEGDGYVSLPEIERVVKTFSPVLWAAHGPASRERFATLVAEGKIPASGLDQDTLQNIFMELSFDFNPDQFDEFMAHTHDTIEFLNDLTEEGRKKQAVWALFMDWDADHSGTLEYDELHTVIINARFFTEHKLGPQHILKAALGTLVPDNKTELAEFVARAKASNIGLDLQQFHVFIKRLLLNLTNDEFYTAIQQIHQCIEYEKKQYTVNKYLTCGLDSATPQTVKQKTIGNLVAGALKDQERNSELKNGRIQKIRTEIRHAFDCITTKDVEAALNNPSPHAAFELVAGATCMLFKLSQKSHTEAHNLHWWATLKVLIKANLKNFVTTLVNFNTQSLNYTQVQRVMKYYFDPMFDSCRLLMISWFMSSLCVWVKKVIHIACLENGWVYPPPLIDNTAHVSRNKTNKSHTQVQNVSWEVLTDNEQIQSRTPVPPSTSAGLLTSTPATPQEPRLPIIDTVFSRNLPKKLLPPSPYLPKPKPPASVRPQTAPTRHSTAKLLAINKGQPQAVLAGTGPRLGSATVRSGTTEYNQLGRVVKEAAPLPPAFE